MVSLDSLQLSEANDIVLRLRIYSTDNIQPFGLVSTIQFPQGKGCQSVKLIVHLHLTLRLIVHGIAHPLPLHINDVVPE